MEQSIRYRGKNYTLGEIDEIREVLVTYQDRSRRFISQEICRRWGLRQPNGALKDMICRGLLLHLEAQGFIELPPRKKNPLNPLSRRQKPEFVEVDQTPCCGKLSDLRPIELVVVRRTPLERLYKEFDRRAPLFGILSPCGRAFGISCDLSGAGDCLLRMEFGSSSHWVSRSPRGVD
jgi:hypothetical protein